SVGHYITQMAVQDGREVIGTASQAKAEIVLSAGAAACIDYQKEDVGERLLELTEDRGGDAIIDMDFSSTLRLIPSQALKAKGSIYCYGSNDMGELGVSFRDLLFKSISLRFFLVYELTVEERLAAIARLQKFIRSGTAVTRISHVLPFDEIVRAHQLVETGQATGNVVLEL
ncbi:MAG: zinc-binding dehydrogenase, partial [Pseudomonadota bacterium]